MGEIGELSQVGEREVEWRIPNFLSLPKDEDKWFWSPIISIAAEDWCLWICPYGKSRKNSLGHVGLDLGRYSGGPTVCVTFSLAVKTTDGENHHQQQMTHDFERWGRRGFPCFLKRTTLLQEKSLLLPSDILTIVCSFHRPGVPHDAADAKCPHCKETVASSDLSSHEKKCVNKPIKCPECSVVVALKNWYDHECQTPRTDDGGSFAECFYCQSKLDPQKFSMYERKCKDKPIKCPKCSDIILLQNWHDHECLAKEEQDEESLIQDYKKVLLHGKNHDFILRVGDKELRAHQDILRARSRVFESMLNADMKEKNSGSIDVPDCDPRAMEQFLSYVYCGKVEVLDETIMCGLYYIADKYEMSSLKVECCDFIKKSLSFTNVCEVIKLALNHSDSALLEYAQEYFVGNTLEIVRTVEWQCFLKDNLTVGNELFIKFLEKQKKQ